MAVAKTQNSTEPTSVEDLTLGYPLHCSSAATSLRKGHEQPCLEEGPTSCAQTPLLPRLATSCWRGVNSGIFSTGSCSRH